MTTQIFPFCESLTYTPNEPYNWLDRGVHKVTNTAASGIRQTRPLAILPRRFGPLVWDQQVNSIAVFDELRSFYDAHKDGRAFMFFDFDTVMEWGTYNPTAVDSGVIPFGIGDDATLAFQLPARNLSTFGLYHRTLITDVWTPYTADMNIDNTGGTFGRALAYWEAGHAPATGEILGVAFTGQHGYMCYFEDEACAITRYSSNTWTVRLSLIEAVGEVPVE